MVLYCSLCSNISSEHPGLMFHRLPKEDLDQVKWVQIVETFRGEQINPKTLRICTMHFAYGEYKHGKRTKILKSGVIPTVEYRYKTNTPETNEPPLQGIAVSHIVTPPSSPSITVLSQPRVVGQRTPLSHKAKKPYNSFTAEHIKNHPARLKAYTGFQSKEVFESFFEFFEPAIRKIPLVNTESPAVLKPNPSTPRRKSGPRSLLLREDQFLLTLMRLRKNIQEDVLADMFQVSIPTVSRTLNTWIIVMAKMIEHTPIWPTREQVIAKLPESYQAFPNIRVIIDCTEFEIETPSSLIVQKGSFSNYKQRNTVKALIGITPYGQISFASMLYEGSTSDKKIFNHCGIMSYLQPGDAIMADRGFTTAEECQENGITLITPDFLSGSNQLSPAQVQNTRSIASLRVLVENKIGSIKNFQILHNKIPLTLAAIISPIFTVCSYLSNFTVKPDLDEENVSLPVGNTEVDLNRVILPSDLITAFMNAAETNTENNIETLGFLMAEKLESEFRVTTLFLPTQSGTPNSCVCNDDVSVQLYCEENQLVIVGWIHTHPRHSCFMSSVDLHTHYSYQTLLPESIAIVCSPMEARTEVFKIDSDVGLRVLASCNLEGFHFHDNSEDLFCVAGHVGYDDGLITVIIDFRQPDPAN